MADIDLRAFGGLERDVKHLTERIEDLERAIERLETRIATLTALLDQARGARWVVAGTIALISFVVGLAAAAKGWVR
jgi:predicted RNase H-like nuclease (RuvC/YqgF family)